MYAKHIYRYISVYHRLLMYVCRYVGMWVCRYNIYVYAQQYIESNVICRLTLILTYESLITIIFITVTYRHWCKVLNLTFSIIL